MLHAGTGGFQMVTVFDMSTGLVLSCDAPQERRDTFTDPVAGTESFLPGLQLQLVEAERTVPRHRSMPVDLAELPAEAFLRHQEA